MIYRMTFYLAVLCLLLAVVMIVSQLTEVKKSWHVMTTLDGPVEVDLACGRHLMTIRYRLGDPHLVKVTRSPAIRGTAIVSRVWGPPRLSRGQRAGQEVPGLAVYYCAETREQVLCGRTSERRTWDDAMALRRTW
ncbi:MAG: hypothetical protein ACYTHJ_07590 [Planctomycetota bacterium]|jgi:hypothetical protein